LCHVTSLSDAGVSDDERPDPETRAVAELIRDVSLVTVLGNALHSPHFARFWGPWATQQAGPAGIHSIGLSRSPSAEPAALQQQHHCILTDTPTRALLSPPCLVLARLTDDSRERPTQCQLTHFQLPRPRELHHLVFCVGEKDASFQVLLACTYSDVLRRNLDLQPAAGSSHWPCHRQTILAVARRIGAVTPPAKEGHGGREGFGAAHPSRSTLVDRPLGREPSTPFPPRNRPSCRWFACPR
jgi:hypothetical protein